LWQKLNSFVFFLILIFYLMLLFYQNIYLAVPHNIHTYILCNTDRKWLVYYTEIISTQNNQSNLNIISFSTRKIRFTFPLGLKKWTVSFIQHALMKISIRIWPITPFNVILETSVMQFWIYNVYNSTTKKYEAMATTHFKLYPVWIYLILVKGNEFRHKISLFYLTS